MSADSTRLQRSADFTRTFDQGVRVSARDLLITVAPLPSRWPDPAGLRPDVAVFGGPRLGLIVSKKVGNAVTRHAVARRLRHAFAASRDALPSPEAFVVVRARPGAAGCSSTDLADQLRRGFAQRKVTAAFDAAAQSDAAADVPVS
ncbi:MULTISPECIES: ribonuclease P protein component [unclassified Gordonia (in: high G+C Gram-positive bacteria)]|uniref:ribonuclease P protein component n=1 Tax=unclassified Gordonia (in: high G+C Gram-positive bacteria) TaxID=2657482 RepID=UPI001FFF9BF8|nr:MULTISPECIES: ribonuclease P protein component [unclassified Gordonia (in: high G+C Gram-positive bacteria)]UQE75074.1 ribonuclease P protein component [Gordonia sp. PP30]